MAARADQAGDGVGGDQEGVVRGVGRLFVAGVVRGGGLFEEGRVAVAALAALFLEEAGELELGLGLGGRIAGDVSTVLTALSAYRPPRNQSSERAFSKRGALQLPPLSTLCGRSRSSDSPNFHRPVQPLFFGILVHGRNR